MVCRKLLYGAASVHISPFPFRHWLWDKDHCCGSRSRYRASRETEIPAQQEGRLGNLHQSPAKLRDAPVVTSKVIYHSSSIELNRTSESYDSKYVAGWLNNVSGQWTGFCSLSLSCFIRSWSKNYKPFLLLILVFTPHRRGDRNRMSHRHTVAVMTLQALAVYTTQQHSTTITGKDRYLHWWEQSRFIPTALTGNPSVNISEV